MWLHSGSANVLLLCRPRPLSAPRPPIGPLRSASPFSLAASSVDQRPNASDSVTGRICSRFAGASGPFVLLQPSLREGRAWFPFIFCLQVLSHCSSPPHYFKSSPLPSPEKVSLSVVFLRQCVAQRRNRRGVGSVTLAAASGLIRANSSGEWSHSAVSSPLVPQKSERGSC